MDTTRRRVSISLLGGVIVAAFVLAGGTPPHAVSPWSLNATIIEACSCPASPGEHAGHAPGHFCKFNNVFRVNSGYAGSTKLDGAKFWIAGDLGGDFSQGQMDWAVLHFDPSVAPDQREAIKTAMGHLYPVTWSSFTIGPDAPIEWTASKSRAVARLDGGKAGEVVLRKNPGMTDAPVVINNLKYWGAPRNSGFILMPNEVEAYQSGDKPYEYKGTNGFMITVDISSADVKEKS